VLAIATANLDCYLGFGRSTAQAIADTLSQHGISVAKLENILDFGCGAARVLRHLPRLTNAQLWGTDTNRLAIRWCRRNLPSVKFNTNPLVGGLPYPDNAFDFIYALSVFTHMTEAAERLWVGELARILQPNAHLMITLRGDAYKGSLSPQEREVFDAGRMVVRNPAELGKNQCDGFHPRAHIDRVFGPRFEEIARLASPEAFLPRVLPRRVDPGQDVLLFKRRDGQR
jgi:SAM-dependent methyltransferase